MEDIDNLPDCVPISLREALFANQEWGANCGPMALSAVTGVPLAELRPIFEQLGFMEKKYTSPGMMSAALEALGDEFSAEPCKGEWPVCGLVRIQWQGPWMDPDAHHMEKQRRTHWIATWLREDGDRGVFDFNACGNDSGWCSLEDWENMLVPQLYQHVPELEGGTGGYQITDVVEVRRVAC